MNTWFVCRWSVLCAPLLVCGIAHAQGIASERLIDRVLVTGERVRTAPADNVTTASRTADELREQNLVNVEDSLKYLPDLAVRKRYIGDRNALIGGRSFSTLQAPRALVFADGYLLSNFLGRFDAPRWNMVAPEEVERVDVLYGPYSALYPGNSIGTTVVMTTRKPEHPELSVRATGFGEHFSEYGLSDNYGGFQTSAYLGDRFDSGLWFTVAANHDDSIGHPLQYYTISANAAGKFPVVSGPGIPVTGVRFDVDPQGLQRAVFGTSGEGVEHTLQNMAKVRLGYAFSDALEADAFVGWWHNDTTDSERTLLRDAAGKEVLFGNVSANGITFAIPGSALVPAVREEEHLQWGATLRTTRPQGWNGSAVYSGYDIRSDHARQPLTLDPASPSFNRGLTTSRDGTGWQTFELQGVYTPRSDDWGHGEHTLAIGLHQNEYQLRNPVFNTALWTGPNTSLSQNVFGDTRLQAAYAQDRWAFAERWALTAGVRYERWRAFNGGQFANGVTPLSYPARSIDATSPKLSLRWQTTDDFSLRLSGGKGVRFPTVAELFQGTVTTTSIQINDPNLKPERSNSVEIAAEQRFSVSTLRVSLFQDDVHDSIFGQTNITVVPNIMNVQNVDRVRTRGVEAVWHIDDVGIRGVAIDANVAYAKSLILEDANNPLVVGKFWPRVPRWRANLTTTWRPTIAWLASLGVRYSGRTYNQLDNSDINPDVYGGVSRFTVLDARVAYTMANHIELAFGIDNLTDEHYYQFHPFPGRTGFVEARWTY